MFPNHDQIKDCSKVCSRWCVSSRVCVKVVVIGRSSTFDRNVNIAC